jgi:hypothetical protein
VDTYPLKIQSVSRSFFPSLTHFILLLMEFNVVVHYYLMEL